MYSEWKSLEATIQSDTSNVSVLDNFPVAVGKEVACSVVRHLATNLNIGALNNEPSKLGTDKDVKWTMEVICYGLHLPLSEHEAVKECVNVYCDWLTCLIRPSKISVPPPVLDDPNVYGQTMVQHLFNLFIPRDEATVDQIHRQVLLCHRVLRTVQTTAKEASNMSRDTWETILKFLLAVNDRLLAPPTVKGDLGAQLCERIVSVLFEVWLLACARCFPGPSLWRTFRDMSQNWRHNECLIVQWHRVNYVLASRLLVEMYGPDYPELVVGETEAALITPDMSSDCIAQSWFRFLHTIGNPCDLAKPRVISQTTKFLQMALTNPTMFDPGQHACLKGLPRIFLRAMRGVSELVDSFLGMPPPYKESTPPPQQPPVLVQSLTPPQRRSEKKLSLIHSQKGSQKSLSTPKLPNPSPSVSATSSPAHLTLDAKPPLAGARPTVNSILHLFGAWLFEASLVDVTMTQNPTNSNESRSSLRGEPVALEGYDEGRAEALGALCRIFGAHRTGENILPQYLSRFYITLYHGLKVDAPSSGLVLAKVLFNAYDILRADLDGVMVLLPRLLQALELVLSDTPHRVRECEQIPAVELRKASIHILLSMLCLPLHFQGLGVQEIFRKPGPLGESSSDPPSRTFVSIKPQITELLLRALTNETDSSNTHMLLGGLLLLVLDLANCETAIASKRKKQEREKAAVAAAMNSTTASTAVATATAELGAQGARTQKSGQTGATAPATRTRTSVPPELVAPVAPNQSSIKSGAPGGRPRKSGPTESAATGARPRGMTANMEESGLKSKDFDTSYGLFGGAASLVCNRLMATWKSDLNIALSAIEVLSGLAKVKLRTTNHLMCKRTVKWICDFIVFQCSRPAPAHSKDLHSMIVAAFQSLTVWLVEHHYLLQDKECLHYVLEVVELGISGSKSQPDPRARSSVDSATINIRLEKDNKLCSVAMTTQNRASDVPKMKGEKEAMPASMRVRDAAEAVLTSIMEQVGSFPPPSGPEAPYSLLDEESLMKFCKDDEVPEYGSSFRYYVLENSIIVSLLEQPLGNNEAPLPTVTAIVRGPFGRHAWTMQLRHLPRHHKVASTMYLTDPGRPEPQPASPERPPTRHRWFPESVDRIPLTKADKSIPPLESVVVDKPRHEMFKQLISEQVAADKKRAELVKKTRESRPFPNPEFECKQPSVSHEFQTARLFLSHYGFLTLESLKEPPNSSIPPSLAALDSSQTGFMDSLHQLDTLPSRTTDTVNVFYVKTGQKSASEILNNVSGRRALNDHFMEFLLSLGWPVEIQRHPGWTGNPSTSWKVQSDDSNARTTHCSLFDGQRNVIYWSDVSSEIVFIVTSSDVLTERRRTSLDTSGTGVDHLLHSSKSAPSFLQSTPSPPFSKSSPKLLTSSARNSPKSRDERAISTSPSRSPRNLQTSGCFSPTATATFFGDRRSPQRRVADRASSYNPSDRSSRDRASDKSLDSSHRVRLVDYTDSSERSPTLNAPKQNPPRPPKTLDLETAPKTSEKDNSPSTPADAPSGARSRRTGRQSMTSSLPDCKVFIIWLESYEDAQSLPLNDLLQATYSTNQQAVAPGESTNQRPPPPSTTSVDKDGAGNVYVLMIHALQNGLFRINVTGPTTRVGLAGPLVDGMVVSRRSMGALVRQTAVNIGKRRRQLDSESHQPPHVRRKLKIQDITNRYRSRMTEAEFYTSLFQDVPS